MKNCLSSAKFEKKKYIDRVHGCFPRQIENSCQRDNYSNLQNRPQFLFLEVENSM